MDRGPTKLLCDPEQKAELEAANGVEQLKYIDHLVSERGARELRESHVLELHELAIQGIYACGGKFRTANDDVRIHNSPHELPEPAFVPGLVSDTVAMVNGSRREKSALDRAAYALWRFNWIHPFRGGNGRTSRAVTYLIVCMDNEAMLPGTPTMPRLIYDRRNEYIVALRAVDETARDGSEPNVTAMRDFLREVLIAQMAHAVDRLAGG